MDLVNMTNQFILHVSLTDGIFIFKDILFKLIGLQVYGN